MSEYDLQFQADLEKAQALSLESLALEQFRRQKLANTGSENNGRDLAASSRRGQDCEPPPALPPPPRKPPRRPSNADNTTRSSGASPTRDDSSDLISFSSPTSKTAPRDPHASLKEYINKLGQQPEEPTTPVESPVIMNNHPYNQRPGFPPTPNYSPQYPYYNQQQYPIPPYPTTPYTVPAMPTMPMPYYIPPPADPNNPYQMYPALPNIPYNQTRLATPAPYVQYPTQVVTPTYNYNNTNMIARPPRPQLYPNLSQMHTYPPPSGSAQSPAGNVNVNVNASAQSPTVNMNNNTTVKNEPSRDSVESNTSGKSSESNESADTIGSLPKSLNLIDFGRKPAMGAGAGVGSAGSVRVSVLEAFDPLLTDQSTEYVVASECSSSVYEEYDPLDFLYGETEMRDTPVYATISKRESTMLPSPPPKAIPSVPAMPKRTTTNKLYDCIVKTRTRNYDSEHKAFLKMVLDVRKRFVYTDETTNPGHVIAARSGGRYPPNTSIKILVHHQHNDEPITFTSDVESTVEHVILTVVCSLEEDIREDMSDYMLRVWGAKEYLTPGSNLSEYDYIRECVRLEKDVKLCLHEGRDATLARTERDDARDAHLTLDDLIPSQGTPSLSFDNLSILLETLEGELSRAVGVTGAEGCCSPKAVFQAVKAICALAGGVETLHVTHTLNSFAQACTSQGNSNVVTPEIHADNGPYCNVSIRSATAREAVSMQCGRVRDAVRSLVALYSRTRLLDFALAETHYLTPNNVDKAIPAHTISETTLFCIEAVHCLPHCWNHDEYLLHAQVYYGTRPLKTLHLTQSSKIECAGFYPRIIFDTWLNLEDLPIYTLPRESRLVLTLHGRTQRPDDQHQNNETSEEREENADVQFEQQELGWAAIQMFDYDGMLASGHYILPLWPPCCDRRIGPAPHPMNSPPNPHPLVNIEIPLYTHTGVKWTETEETKEVSREELPAFDSLDGHLQAQLLHLIEQGAYQRMPTDCREVMWEKRQYLVQLPGALPLVLLAAANWYGEQRAQLVALVKVWEKPSPLNAMHLLLPCFPDNVVRETAATLMNEMPDDDLCRILPQLAQALRHETYETGPLAALLLSRALASPTVAHKLFWLLVHSLPNVPHAPSQEFLGISLDDNSGEPAEVDATVTAAWRYRLMLRALLAVCGEKLTNTLMRQQLLVKTLSEVAMSVKNAKEGQRQRALCVGGERLAAMLRHAPAALPLALHRYVRDVDIKSCTYFASNTLPLKINFIGTDNALVPAMFKVGDDLRQDSLVLQVIKIMDSLWLKAGLDLRIVTFQALPTSDKRAIPVKQSSQVNRQFNQANQHSSQVDKQLSQGNQGCFICSGKHRIYDCPSFSSKNVHERIKQVTALGLCLNCLRSGSHNASTCKLSSCRVCQLRHNTMLHTEDTQSLTAHASNTENTTSNTSTSSSHQVALSSTSLSIDSNNQGNLSTALVNVINPVTRRAETVRAALDCGSTSSLITTSLKERLQLVSHRLESTTIVGIGNIVLKDIVPESCTLTLESRCSPFSVMMSCLALPELTDLIPKYYLNVKNIQIPSDITLADPNFHTPGKVDMIIGLDLFWDLLNPQQLPLGKGLPTLHSSKLGWIIPGSPRFNINTEAHSKMKINCNLSAIERLDHKMSKFWELEELPVKQEPTQARVDSDNPCEKHFMTHTIRLKDGRFSVRLPLIDTPDCLGNSYFVAKQRFLNLEKRFKRQPALKELYCAFMKEYEDLGHMSESSVSIPENSYFVPHHPVLREHSESTKCRVVYDASHRTRSGLSINDIQMIGPNIQDSLFNILVRFRQYKYVLTGDIEKMYRQIQVNELDRDLQLILWRTDPSESLKTYRLNTVTYGFASASYLSTRCLWQLGEECQEPHVKTILQNDFYVDDLITGCESESSLFQIQDSVSKALVAGCFVLRKFRTNSKALVDSIAEKCESNLALSQSCHTLGLNWNPNIDTLQFPISIQAQDNTSVTKRSILSQTFQIFDPLGILSPVTIKPKILMQRLWTQKVDWDSVVPADVQKSWRRFIDNLESINEISIPRNVIGDFPVSVELHAFSDASQAAYSACVYVKSVNQAGNVAVRLFCAKARVAPSKQTLTIPRLELSGALLAARLVRSVRDALRRQISGTYFWSDSSIVLGWLATEPSRLKLWVCNRVSQINELTESSSFRHVPTALNPADIASRGIDPHQIQDFSLWWHGPQFLTQPEAQWPSLNSSKIDPLPELKVHITVTTEPITPCIDMTRYSKLTFLQRVTAYVCRFIHNCKNSQSRNSGPLQVLELDTAFTHLVKLSQRDSFSQEINTLKRQAQLKPKSLIASLSPYLSSQNILRVGGRISASEYDYDKKHPILLHAKHHFTRLLFAQEHNRLLHAGPQLLLASIRDRFWPVGGRDLARRTTRSCVKCRRMSARPLQNIMGNLPMERLSPDVPFATVSADFGGPFMITDRKTRGCRITKAYLCLFICFRSKCVHLEAVSELSGKAFMLTLQRFTSRRGKPRQIFCDNGRNFVAVSNELSTFLRQNSDFIVENASNENIEFRFCPVYAPNFNGLAEAGIKAAKYHLKRILGDRHFTFEELSTIFTQVEAILNSRPLCPLSTSPHDFTPLTPGHFLIGRPLTSLPTPPLEDKNPLRLDRYLRIEQARQHFWRRWQSEYISELQQRIKWRIRCRDLQPGDMVLLKEDNTSPLQWRMGRVARLFPGADGIPRVADIQTARGIVRRALSKICLLQAEASNGGEDVRAPSTHTVEEPPSASAAPRDGHI